VLGQLIISKAESVSEDDDYAELEDEIP